MKIKLNNYLVFGGVILIFTLSLFAQNDIQRSPSKFANFCAVRLKVEFSDSGKVGKIILVSSSCNDEELGQEATKAAKQIKFLPTIKDGKPISVTKTIEYTFNVYDEKADAIIKKAVEKLGGQKYLQAKSQVSSGNYTLIAGGQPQPPSSFTDVLVFPDKERTEFKRDGVKTIQTNAGDTGWIFDGATKIIKLQSKSEIEDFQRGLRASLDNLLRGGWRDKAALNYVGRRQASVGKRNDVVRLTYADDFAVEFEFADDGLPVKAIYKRKNSNGEDLKEEDRYAQFVEVRGIFAPFIVDHFINDQHASRINYLNIEFNKNVSDSIFNKPNSPKM